MARGLDQLFTGRLKLLFYIKRFYKGTKSINYMSGLLRGSHLNTNHKQTILSFHSILKVNEVRMNRWRGILVLVTGRLSLVIKGSLWQIQWKYNT